MANQPRIAIDAMGGDGGLVTMLSGASIALERTPSLRFVLSGDEGQVNAALADHPAVRAASIILHAPETIDGAERAGQALRRAKVSSMGLAIDAVKRGVADAAVSAGNTGALMGMAKVALRTMPGIDRPALAALLPSLGKHDLVMLDLGANTECEVRNLVEFAIMGAAYSRTALGLERPRTALLNIGSEDQKGTETIRAAAAALRASDHLHLDFTGFIEGDKISRGNVDVVVCDGFSGNIALKTMEGTARFVTDLLRRSFTSSLRAKIGYLILRPATELLKTHLDPDNHNGAVFLGLNGVVVKSHGSASPKGVANAIDVSAKLVANGITKRISDDLALVRMTRR